MKKTTVYIFIWILIVSLILIGAIVLVRSGNKNGQLDQFASCIQESGAKFYGSFACSHCQNQKALFGKSSQLLPYIECSTPDATRQLEVCEEAKISNYPTWIFPNGQKVEGEQTLEELAKQTNCALPPSN